MTPLPPLILASASPRRRQLLAQAGLAFRVVPADIPERVQPGESPEAAVRRLAQAKAAAVAARFPDAVVLGADTTVALGAVMLGKPRSTAESRAMLRRLAGRRHRVITGVCLLRLQPRRQALLWACTTFVRFRQLSEADIETYLARVHTLDKAGAYAIQESGEILVEAIQGLRSNVIGLPVEEVLDRLREFTE